MNLSGPPIRRHTAPISNNSQKTLLPDSVRSWVRISRVYFTGGGTPQSADSVILPQAITPFAQGVPP